MVGGSIPDRVKSKTEKLTPVASLFNIHHFRTVAGLVGPVLVSCDWVGYHVNLRHDTSLYWPTILVWISMSE